MNVADKLIEILESGDVTHIFGLPGEQILPFYKSLQKSGIKHVLLRHEQAAAHAADAYSRSSHKFGVCLSTASPGALNMVMAVATAFKDNVPLLVITGDNPTDIRDSDAFQSFPLASVFENITFKNFNPKNGSEAIGDLLKIMDILKREPCGPIHLNLSKDVLLEDVDEIPKVEKVNIAGCDTLDEILEKIEKSEKPLLILGSGARFSAINEIAISKSIPTTTTFPGRGIVSESEKVNLGLIGNRGTNQTRYALENADCVIAIGTRLSERTLQKDVSDKLIHVNINKNHLKGNYKVHMPAEDFVSKLKFKNADNWLDEILHIESDFKVEGVDDESLPLRPPSAISSILKQVSSEIIVADAGSHTTWTTLLSKCIKPGQLLFSGALAPMGYGIPASIGAAFATGESVVLINGDGDFQMNLQELATISENNLPITICVINNSAYAVIKQTEKNVYKMEPYEVDFENPDFIKIANAYNIKAKRVSTKSEVEEEVKKAIKSRKPYLIEINVRYEDIPLPKN